MRTEEEDRVCFANSRLASQAHRAFCERAHAHARTRTISMCKDRLECLSFLSLSMRVCMRACRLQAYVVIHGLSQSMLLRQKEAKQKAGKHLA